MSRATLKAIQAAAGNAGEAVYVEDVFSTYLYDGTGTTNNIVNGVDLTEGGLVWFKTRDDVGDHNLVDSERGINKGLESNTTDAETGSAGVTAFNSDGFTVDFGFAKTNSTSSTYASWTFRKQPGFFDVVTYTTVSGVMTIPHNLGTVPGCWIMKSTNSVESWWVHHRSIPNQLMRLEGTSAAESGFSTATSTDITIPVGVWAPGVEIVIYLFAHDAQDFGTGSNESIIKCGSYTGNGTSGHEIDVGFEPQWVLQKASDTGNAWTIIDVMRGMTGQDARSLQPNSSSAEQTVGQYNPASIQATATGFKLMTDDEGGGNGNGNEYIYIAIRRPMKTPESGTEVFNTITRTGNGTTTSVTGVGFPPDLFISRPRTGSSGLNSVVVDRLRGAKIALSTRGTYAEQTENDGVTIIGQDGVTVGASQSGFFNGVNYPSDTLAYWNFRRAPGFFDVVAYTGDGVSGRAISHNLSTTPELMMIKVRDFADNWYVHYTASGFGGQLNTANAIVYSGRVTSAPNASSLFVSSNGEVNGSGKNYIAYLFASVAGVSKVGSYTGTGADLNVNCGFSAGARFVLIKRSDSGGTGDWYVWDSERGIVAGNDPYLLLNSTAAEVTSTDYIDPLSSGFTVTSSAPAALNASGGSYIFLAIA
jgi:hypothetical protein